MLQLNGIMNTDLVPYLYNSLSEISTAIFCVCYVVLLLCA